MDKIKQHIGARIRKAREAAGMYQHDLVKAVVHAGGNEVTFQAISHYEAGRRMPRADEMVYFAIALGVEPGYFYEGILERV